MARSGFLWIFFYFSWLFATWFWHFANMASTSSICSWVTKGGQTEPRNEEPHVSEKGIFRTQY